MRRYLVSVIFFVALAIFSCTTLNNATDPTTPPDQAEQLDAAIIEAGNALALPTAGVSSAIAGLLVTGLVMIRRIRSLNQVIREIDTNEDTPTVDSQLSSKGSKKLAEKVLLNTVSKGTGTGE